MLVNTIVIPLDFFPHTWTSTNPISVSWTLFAMAYNLAAWRYRWFSSACHIYNHKVWAKSNIYHHVILLLPVQVHQPMTWSMQQEQKDVVVSDLRYSISINTCYWHNDDVPYCVLSHLDLIEQLQRVFWWWRYHRLLACCQVCRVRRGRSCSWQQWHLLLI